MLFAIFVAFAVIFVGYAIVTQYNKTPYDQSIPHRLWLALSAAAVTILAAVSAWFHMGATP